MFKTLVRRLFRRVSKPETETKWCECFSPPPDVIVTGYWKCWLKCPNCGGCI